MKDIRVGTTNSGLKIYTEADTPRIYIPKSRRRPLHVYEFQHKAIHHMTSVKMYNKLAKSYYWPTMKCDVREWHQKCNHCELLKAKRNLTHSKYRSASGIAPRKRWVMNL